MITVVAAVIVHEGRVLICQRRADDRFPLKWEFPGGKVKGGETLEGALRRELREELGVEPRIGKEVYRTRHKYAEMEEEVELIFFAASMNAGAVQNLGFAQVVWEATQELPAYDFLPADLELLQLLATRKVQV